MDCYQRITALTPRQLEVFRMATARIIVLHGCVRTGKTVTQAALAGKMIENALKNVSIPSYIAMAKSVENCHYNIQDNMREFFGSRVVKPSSAKSTTFAANWTRNDGRTIEINYRCVGWSTIKSTGTIMGQNIDGVLIDEGQYVPLDVFEAAGGRQNRDHAQCIITTNPGSASHYLKKNFIDKADGKHIQEFFFKLEDNPFLSKDYLEFLERTYSGVNYRRFVLGEWCDASGLIYRFFGDEHMMDYAEDPTAYYCGFDWGMNHPCAAVLLGFNASKRPQVWVEDEFITDPKDPNFSDPNSINEEFWRWINGRFPRQIFVDPSAIHIRSLFAQNPFGCAITNASNDVLPGIQCVSRLMRTGRVKIVKSCKRLIEELQTYAWDENKCKSQGKDVPVKIGDDLCDALRYVLFSLYGTEDDLEVSDQIIKRPQLYNPFLQNANIFNTQPRGFDSFR